VVGKACSVIYPPPPPLPIIQSSSPTFSRPTSAGNICVLFYVHVLAYGMVGTKSPFRVTACERTGICAKAFLFFHNESAFPGSWCVSELPTLRLLLLLLWKTVTWNLNSVLCPPRSFSRDQRTGGNIRRSSVVPCYVCLSTSAPLPISFPHTAS